MKLGSSSLRFCQVSSTTRAQFLARGGKRYLLIDNVYRLISCGHAMTLYACAMVGKELNDPERFFVAVRNCTLSQRTKRILRMRVNFDLLPSSLNMASPSVPVSLFSESDDDSTEECEGINEASTSGPTSSSSILGHGVSTLKAKHSRKNTLAEKRKMRRERVKRKRSKKEKIRKLQREVNAEHQLRKHAEQATLSYKSMSRTYWERWRWELHKRREAMANELQACRTLATRTHNQLQGTVVAVKEFLPRSVVADVLHEASILASLCHPYLPLLFGVCTQQQPLRIVMQFHAFEGLQPSTIRHELQNHHFDGHAWVLLCAQLLEALTYLHEEAHVLHNDLKVDNVLVAQSVALTRENYQVVLIDFGKATRFTEAKRYSLSEFERREYIRKYPHIAPESTFSDMFSFDKVLYQIMDHNCIADLPHTQQSNLSKFADKLMSVRYYSRPSCQMALDFFRKLMD